MTPNQINVALIGCGRIAGHHIKSIGAVDGVNLVAVCDLDAAKAQPYGEDNGVSWHTNYRTMLAENPGIDTVAIITPSGDPFTLAVLSVPMYLFYEIAILFGRIRIRRAKKAADAA